MICTACSSIFNEEDLDKHICSAQALPPANTEIRVRYTPTHVIFEQINMTTGDTIRYIQVAHQSG
jgi:hypothetical protein